MLTTKHFQTNAGGLGYNSELKPPPVAPAAARKFPMEMVR